MRSILIIAYLYLLSMVLPLAHVTAQTEIKAFYVGHSLSDQIPDMVKSLADDHQSTVFDWAYQSIPGAPLHWQWARKDANDYVANPPYYYGFYDEEGGLPTGNFDVMVLTEAVPRYDELIGETYEFVDSFFVYARQHNPYIRVLLYEDWHCLLSGTPTGCDYDVDSNPWRQRLEDDLPMWESVVDTINNRFGHGSICMIPAAQGLAQVYDSIYAGVMPELTTIEDLFVDNIHLTDVGKYFIACVHFATIFETSPVGLTNQLQVWWGGDFEAPSPELALKFQEIAWDVAVNYENSCLWATVDTEQYITKDDQLTLSPNPVSNTLRIEHTDAYSNSQIYTVYGELLLESNSKEINVAALPAGVYFLVNGDQIKKFVKQ